MSWNNLPIDARTLIYGHKGLDIRIYTWERPTPTAQDADKKTFYWASYGNTGAEPTLKEAEQAAKNWIKYGHQTGKRA